MTFRTALPTPVQTRRTLLRFGVAVGAVLATGQLRAQITDKVKVAAVYPVPIGQPWVSRVHKALVMAQHRGEITYVYSENVSASDYAATLRKYAKQGVQLIISEAFDAEAETNTRRVANDYPEIAFLVGSANRPQQPNFAVFDNYIQEPIYLTGMIAGGLSQTGIIGLVAGYPVPKINRLLHAFMDGVREINPDAKFLVTFVQSWFDPLKATHAALAQIDQGADVLFAERLGVAEAAQQRGKLVIGCTMDTQPQYPDTVVTSAIWDVEPTMERALTMVKRGTFKADDYGKYSQMRYEGAMLAPLGTFQHKVPSALMNRVLARQQTILDGSFTIKPNQTPPQTSASPVQTSGK